MRQATDVAWAAGLFEGEGCWSLSRHGSKIDGACAQLGSTDFDVIRKFHSIVVVGSVKPLKVRPGRKQVLKWSVSDLDSVKALVSLFAPYLCERRLARGHEVVRLTEEDRARRKRYCKHGGHLWTPENTYTYPSGKRQCRACINLTRAGGPSADRETMEGVDIQREVNTEDQNS